MALGVRVKTCLVFVNRLAVRGIGFVVELEDVEGIGNLLGPLGVSSLFSVSI